MASSAASVRAGAGGAFRPANIPLAMIGLALATFMQVLDLTIANVSLPTIAGNLGASQDQSTWVITSFTVANAITLPLTGFLTRRFGEVRPFIWATLMFSVCSIACGLSTSLGMLVVFRALQGAMAGPMYPITQSLMVSLYPQEKRGSALAILSMIAVLAPIVGPVLGGWITETYSWEWIFFINVPIGIFAAVVVTSQMLHRPEHIDRPRVDFVGLATLVIGIGALQILLDKGNQLDWFHSRTILILAVVSALALSVFLIWELTDREPIVDFSLFLHRNFAAGTVAMVLAYAMFFSTFLLVQLWMQGTIGYSTLWAGLASAPMGFFPLILSVPIGRYLMRYDLRWMAAFSFFVIALTCFMRGRFNTDVDLYHIVLVQLIMGLGIAFFFLPILTILLSDLTGRDVAAGSGLATFLRTVAGSFAVSITTYLWERGTVVHHANLASNINVYSAQVRHGIAMTGGNVQLYAARINHVITQQATQISVNHLFNVFGFLLIALIGVVWFARPPFIKQGGSPASGGSH
ncbi:MAG TPA: DHA2 family efflux MFS transporter permease subunit [Steroidobacteraceae bacterium]